MEYLYFEYALIFIILSLLIIFFIFFSPKRNIMEGFELKYSSNPFISKGFHELLGIPVPNDCPSCPTCPVQKVIPIPKAVPKKNDSIVKKIGNAFKASNKKIGNAFKASNKKIANSVKASNKKISKAFTTGGKKRKR
jgi:hypothetical protein